MKIINKRTILILMVFLFIINITVSSFAWSIGSFNPKKTTVNGIEKVVDFGNSVVSVITVIGIIASVIILIIIGIKYMLGSIEEKATYKKSLLPYVIGAGLLFAASTIANIIYTWGREL